MLLGGPPVFVIWLVEALPADPYSALRLAPSSVASFLVPAAVAVLAAVRLGGPGLAGVLAGATIGFLLASAVAAPVYHPHPWDELDGVWAMWYRWAGIRTIATTAAVGSLSLAAVAVGRRRRGRTMP
jgi:hypothetical protein